jgi:DNA invertase Pin-like site-specific DNA recombinase
MRVGYARVSSPDQNLDTQIARLEKEGCEKIFAEKTSGASDIETREQLQAALKFVREGDELVMLRLDRLTRGGMVETFGILNELTERKVNYKFLDNPLIDTTSSMGRIITMLSAEFAQAFLLELKEKQAAGIALAKARGVYTGRKPTIDKARVIEMLDQKIGPSQIARTLEIGESSVFRIKREHDAAPQADA